MSDGSGQVLNMEKRHRRAWSLASISHLFGFIAVATVATRGMGKFVIFLALMAANFACPSATMMAEFVLRRRNPPAWTAFFFTSSLLMDVLSAPVETVIWTAPVYLVFAVLTAVHAPYALEWVRECVATEVIKS